MKILLTGYGRMGQMIGELAKNAGHEILAAIDDTNAEQLRTLPAADVAIDFSHPTLLPALSDYIRRTHTPLCSGTTGMTEADFCVFDELSSCAPVLYSANYSLGIAVFKRVLSQLPAFMRKDFDVEIMEKHHNKKVDAPSGTALLLADAVDPDRSLTRVCAREGQCGARTRDELGIVALRGGTTPGEHTVYFFGEDEVLSIKHEAFSRRIFAAGALKAALALSGREPGRYTLEEILFG